ncbi:MAG: hypothetical protein M3R63_11535 [Actinomycetota bacterium]|nr:hypothetical protein [Actinomycetota bacterium]
MATRLRRETHPDGLTLWEWLGAEIALWRARRGGRATARSRRGRHAA